MDDILMQLLGQVNYLKKINEQFMLRRFEEEKKLYVGLTYASLF